MTSPVITYIVGADRNNPNTVKAHMYAQTADGDLVPMCGHGWNRSDGFRFSILRGNGSAKGTCATCLRRVVQARPPVSDGFKHPTKWI